MVSGWEGGDACKSRSKNDNFFLAVVWIKWMNIFRPAYFTPRRFRGWGRCLCLGKEPSGKKAIDEAGEREASDRRDPAESKSP